MHEVLLTVIKSIIQETEQDFIISIFSDQQSRRALLLYFEAIFNFCNSKRAAGKVGIKTVFKALQRSGLCANVCNKHLNTFTITRKM